ncbi:unnamed protein product [Rotaria sordida]|uniref:Uncharacterized protein n=1 Tax=Rotaria sordida TaxID=392033 RepID=A0A819EZK1_9BILA|nr:unnamed protein product [Rotaria sordida]CAF3859131.1 unnamed protein product [Rotaria sordida]
MAEAAASSSDTTQAKSPAISFINSDKEKSLLIADEYVFKLNKTTATTNDHNHLSDKEKLEVCEKVKQRAINKTISISRMFYLAFQSCLIFTAGLETRPKQAKTIAIQRRMHNLGKRYYDGAINP